VNENGQDQPLEAIYRRYRQGLFSLAMAITSNAMQAEDAVHDAFTRMCRTGRLFSVAYVFASVRNAARDQLRRRRTTAELPESIFDNRPSPETVAMADEACHIVRQEIDSLEHDQREVVVMKVYGELTFDQIAQTMNEPLQTVASRYRRAMRKLKDQLGTRV
jgi:RNA polymerase sigma factor (sigma-70 family)